MNTNPPLLNKLVVIIGGARAEKQVILFAVKYAANHPLYLSIAGGQISTYFMAVGLHHLQKQTETTRRHIYLVETYTCQQTAVFLEQVSENRQPKQAFFALDFLSLFNDETFQYADARELLAASIQHLKMIRQSYPVMIHIQTTDRATGRKSLIRDLCSQADLVLNENLEVVDDLELLGE